MIEDGVVVISNDKSALRLGSEGFDGSEFLSHRADYDLVDLDVGRLPIRLLRANYESCVRFAIRRDRG